MSKRKNEFAKLKYYDEECKKYGRGLEVIIMGYFDKLFTQSRVIDG